MPMTEESFDTSVFVLPPKVAKLDAVRKLTARLTEVTGLGETGARTLAHSVVDPAAVRALLTEPLPGLTAHRESHLRVIPTRVWTAWLTPPADEIARYSSRKVYPVADPNVPLLPRVKENRDGLTVSWKSRADRDFHLGDNKKLYDSDVHVSRLHILPRMGGIVDPLVLVPQTEEFQDGSTPLSLLRITDGHFRYYAAQELLERYADLEQTDLDGHFGPGKITPEVIRAALGRDRTALDKLVNAVRDACTKIGYAGENQQYIGVHYLASVLSVPAYIAVGTTDPVTSEVRTMGTDTGYPTGVVYTLSHGMGAWHSGNPARVVVTGQHEYQGLLLPEASVDEKLIEVAARRLRIQGVPKEVIAFGTDTKDVRAAARFVWWTRAVRQLGGTPATAVAAFARHAEPDGGSWPQSISRQLLAAAAHMMEEDIDVLYSPADYRDPETRPNSLSLLVNDIRNLTPVAAVSDEGTGVLLAHVRWRNAAHVALAHLALTGALPPEEPLPEHILDPRLLSWVALAWADNRMPVLHDSAGRAVPIDARTLRQGDPMLPRTSPGRRLQYMSPPSGGVPFEATHVFKIKHDVVLTIPSGAVDEDGITADPDTLATVVRRWFPGATGITLTDWSDKYITGIMVGSVFVRLYDRKSESEYARDRGVWYTDSDPDEAKDVVDLDRVDSGAPAGDLLGAGSWLAERDFDRSEVGLDLVYEAMAEELDDLIINEVDEALEAQAAADDKGTNGQEYLRPRDHKIPVLRLPGMRNGQKR